MTDNDTRTTDTNRSADEWERYLEANQNEVLMFVDSDYEIHTLEHEPEKDELCFFRGGTFGYDYEGSRASLEAFAKDDSDIHKLVPREKEYAERKALVDGEFETPKEWANRSIGPDTTQ